MTLALYARVSTKKQTHESQLLELREVPRGHQLRVVLHARGDERSRLRCQILAFDGDD